MLGDRDAREPTERKLSCPLAFAWIMFAAIVCWLILFAAWMELASL